MAQHVVVAIVGAHPEIARGRGVPAPVELAHFKLASTETKTERTFVGTITRIAFDAHFAHGASGGGKCPPQKSQTACAKFSRFEAGGMNAAM
jgi:hypothetical protein